MKKFIPLFGLVVLSFSFPASPLQMMQSAEQNLGAEPIDSPVRIISNKAFSFGEKLKYRVHYGFMNAAIINFEVKPNHEVVMGKNTFRITAEGKTISAFDWFLKVRDRYESNVDMISMLPVKYTKDMHEGNYKDLDFAIFNHSKGVCLHEKGKMNIEKDVLDLISAIYYFRTINLSAASIGQVYPLTIYLDNKLYETSVKVLGKETIKTDIGKIRCIKMRPQLIVDRVFKDADDMTLWVTDDENHIPVRVQSEIMVGSIKLDLVDYKNLRNPLALVK